MQLRLFIILFILGISTGFAQNLVPNPSFEKHIGCYQPGYQIMANVYNWYIPNPSHSNADYLNACPKPTGTTWLYDVPKNQWGYQYPKTGDGYIYIGVTPNTPEYVSVLLNDSLEVGKHYCVSYYVVIPEIVNRAFDKTGCFFTVDSLGNDVNNYDDLYTPQISNPSGNMIGDTLNWIKISGSFTADSAYQCITIGTFVDYSLINTYVIDTSLPAYNVIAYYVDDVAVYACDAPVYVADGGGDVQLCLGDSVVLGSHERDEYLYWWYDMQGNLIADSTGFITVKPHQTTQYELVVKDFKFDETRDTITVYVEDCFTDDIFVPNIFSPNGDGNNDILFVRSEYIQSMKFQIYNRWGEMVFESKDINYGWNGEYNGKRCNPAVFVWHLEATMTNGQVVQRSGNVTLVR
jgi:gliding motility-associated-like protein